MSECERVRVGSRWNSADSQQGSAPTVRGELGLCSPVNISGSVLALMRTALLMIAAESTGGRRPRRLVLKQGW